MRVQAKRALPDSRLRIRYKQQRKLLLKCAKADKVRPLYCIYCTEPQRSFWTKCHPKYDYKGYQTGCLLADANHVPETTTKLCRIERKCFPWHFLLEGGESRWDGPTIAELNCEGDGDFNCTGVHETNEVDLYRLNTPEVGHANMRDRGIHRILVIDVRVQE